MSDSNNPPADPAQHHHNHHQNPGSNGTLETQFAVQPQGVQQQPSNGPDASNGSVPGMSVSSVGSQNGDRKPKAPSVRRACVACHTGKTRCSEVLPCQSCLKRGLGSSCAYPDPDSPDQHGTSQTTTFAPPMYAPPPSTLSHTPFYDYNGALTGASTSTFRPAKRPRPLTDEETAAITRGFTRGDFYVGSSAPVRIDPRLTVRLTLGEGDQVHFAIGEQLV